MRRWGRPDADARLAPVPAEQIAASLAYINWTVLTGLAVGSFGAVVLGLLRTSATKGYLAFVALTSAAFGLLAWLSDGALPGPGELGPRGRLGPVLGDAASGRPRPVRRPRRS